MKEQITLCGQCCADYEAAGYELTFDRRVRYKEPCDKCGRAGWTYLIERDGARGTGPKQAQP